MNDQHPNDELQSAGPGTTMVLTPEGWEVSDYLDPADDWTLLDDGSYVSPDSTFRTWPLVNPTPD